MAILLNLVKKYRCLVTASGWELSVVKYYVNYIVNVNPVFNICM